MNAKLMLLTASAALALPLAPTAHADTTINAVDICHQVNPNYIPVFNPFQNAGSCADNPAAVGLFYTPTPISGFMHGRYNGSFPVDPGNPFSDWIIPEGARPAPPPPLIACDRTHCGPDVVVPCSGRGAPCG
ncbi:hypothetical protein CIW52_32190 [Mycolicibacterium sp. P9-64]|uniref:hypothetical protein n=1 Tax=Mycolicibacterium sp. P9-64 TaxID=2024612 RepID=UPI0011EE2DCB|nr:hypothetical protein [Mycolicibacterium sp. P9-64]KAA0077242.1 hypothetical protein CIW52_32190 [Mycolicibacterium sp. P9-64]